MSRIFKQKGRSVLFYLWVPLFAQSLPAQTILSQWDRGSLSLRMSPDLKPLIEPVLPRAALAMERITALMSQRPVSKPLTIWLLRDESERTAVLTQMGYPPSASGRFIRSTDQVMVILSPQTESGWMLRFLMGEYARYLLFSGAREDGMEWYRLGLATSLGWFVVEEQEGGDWTSAIQRLTKYYRSRLVQSDVTLEGLMQKDGWKEALKNKDRTQVIARAILLSAWVCEKGGPASGLRVISLWEKSPQFEEALLRGADRKVQDLRDQEKQINTGLPASLNR